MGWSSSQLGHTNQGYKFYFLIPQNFSQREQYGKKEGKESNFIVEKHYLTQMIKANINCDKSYW